jgi:hypothetical protein
MMALAWAAGAATVTGTLEDRTGAPLAGTLEFFPVPPTLEDAGKLAGNGMVPAPLTNGAFAVNLIAGPYNLRVPTILPALALTVPPGTNSYDLLALLNPPLGTFTFVTNALGQISQQVLAGTNIVLTTNNAGLPNETVTISSVGTSNLVTSAQVDAQIGDWPPPRSPPAPLRN